ncbi:MAG TPA: hypothetical protein EYG11_09120 [Candidatus Latescibacteria bacterium]|nr:hypothetical protein [Candidatus Handelsmanbacteria bacterium]HIL08848.1 hypothetical protein [Candidatus Latescibacterota bacterium]
MTQTETDTPCTEANRRLPATPGDKGDAPPTPPPKVQPDLSVAITTIAQAGAQECETAQAIAAELNAPFIARVNGQPGNTAKHSDREGLLIIERKGLALWVAGQTFRYHPNMATMRVRALSQKKNDGLVDALQLKTGASLLDCTCGLGADAIVAAHAVGPTGRVRALESSTLLALLAIRGMARYSLASPPELIPAMRRVEVHHTDFTDYLRRETDNAWDIVYFDPMFSETIDLSQGLDIVRRLAYPDGPSLRDVQEARRVARHRVAMKDRHPGQNLARLGFTTIKKSRRICYGTIDAL